MRLIDGDALKRKAQKAATESWKMKITASVETILNQFIDWIEEAPTIDAVRVIRCEECKYCRRENVTYRYPDGTEREVVDRYINCTKERYQPEVRLDDFCSRGIRKGRQR